MNSPAAALSAPLSEPWNTARVRDAVLIVRACVLGLHDPDFKRVGIEFLNRLAITECGADEETGSVHLQNGPFASYTSFVYPPYPGTNGFKNTVKYGSNICDEHALLFSGFVHEHIHAMQKFAAPALHASPYNGMTHIILCPRDWVAANERCEQDAYAKQAWLNSLYARQNSTMHETSIWDPVSVDTFIAARKKYGCLEKTLRYAATISLLHQFSAPDADRYQSFHDYYRALFLAQYESVIQSRLPYHKNQLVFVRMDEDDHLTIGNSFGPNPFTRDDIRAPFPLSRNQKKSIHALNTALGITDESALPTLGQALKTAGLSKDDFLRRAYETAHTPVAHTLLHPALG